MIKPKLNLFLRTFILLFISLNISGILIVLFQGYQNQSKKINTVLNRASAQVTSIETYYREAERLPDNSEKLRQDIKRFADGLQYFLMEDFCIFKKTNDKIEKIFCAGDGLELKNEKEAAKFFTNRPVKVQIEEQMAANTGMIRVSKLLKEVNDGKLFVLLDITLPKASYWTMKLNEIILFEFFILLVSLIIAGMNKNMVTGFSDKINSTIYHVLNGDHGRRVEISGITEFGKIDGNINLLLEKLEELHGYYEESEKNKNEITHLLNVINRASDGDFTIQAEVSDGLLGYFADSFNMMLVELGKLFLDVKTAADQMTNFARDILKNTKIFSESTELQSQQIEKMFTATKDMASQLDIAFNKAQSAQNSIFLAGDIAKKGSNAINDSLEQTHRLKITIQDAIRNVMSLSEYSKEIQDILEVSKDFTAQTNLLALNATIEASRGGETGKGFAYVADEIRDLAEKSKKAAKDIQKLLENIQKGTEKTISAIEVGANEAYQGAEMVEKAGNSFGHIVDTINQTSEMIGEMVNAFEVQAQKSNEIVKAMAYLANIAQNAAKGVSETSTLSVQMDALSQNLKKAIARFKIKETNFGVIK